MRRLILLLFLIGVCLTLVTACGDLGYYLQCATGHMDLMARARPIEDAIEDPGTDPAARSKLVKVLKIRSFATEELALPQNGSYQRYADIGRPYVVWNVVAAPEFSLKAKDWCFPVAGCVSYRGYFDHAAADAFGAELAGQGYDVDVYGVRAYSTLKWFDDPVLNTFLGGEEAQVAALIFHELAHQVAYVPGDSAFNEAFAKTVELEGLHRWLRANSSDAEWQECLAREERSKAFQELLKGVRDELAGLYSEPLSSVRKRAAKQVILDRARERYRSMRADWPDAERFDAWMARGLNNARLASVATYRELVPAFQAMLQRKQGDLAAFYAEVADLGRLPVEERLARLRNFERDALLARVNERPRTDPIQRN